MSTDTATPTAALAERLAARTLALVDARSESRAEAELAAAVLRTLQDGGVPARDAGDTCVIAGADARGERPLVLLLGHLDTVPAQGNWPGRRADGHVEGLGAADMKGGVAVMVELALGGLAGSSDPAGPARPNGPAYSSGPVRPNGPARSSGPADPAGPAGPAVDVGWVFFGREEIASTEGALAPLLAREPGLRGADLAIVLEPTANVVQAGCLGNLDAAWTFRGRSGHSARPWLAENAIERAARGVLALAQRGPTDVVHGGLTFRQVASVTRLEAGVASNVIPGTAVAHVNVRYDPALAPEQAEAALRSWCEPYGEIELRGITPGALPPLGNPLADALARAAGAPIEPKQAWTPVAELAAAGVEAVNFGPGDPAYAHRADERVAVDALVRCHDVLRSFLCA